ncbi:endothelin-converting enzyme 1 [Plakobranchus ocellatus]|uniref:Endothelin-converting enzyme 1 n=1 Tax=Plakobranchus ocellatus TaxID=259542 RepID=A0AAV4DTE0_9GAST|nr:endothelin-converting enzyme 1 [Plakobranchus ocellatus]
MRLNHGYRYLEISLFFGFLAAMPIAYFFTHSDNLLTVNLNSVSSKCDAQLQNSFGFKFAHSKVRSLPERFRNLYFGLLKAVFGTKEIVPRSKFCLGEVIWTFPRGISKVYTLRRFSKDSKTYVTSMTDDIRTTFKEILLEAKWMGNKTKTEALRKLATLNFIVGYPDHGFSQQEINERYSQFVMTTDHFYNNREIALRNIAIKNLQKVKELTDETELPARRAIDVSATYVWDRSQIAIYAGILQPPYFSETFPDYIKYGAIGSVIGHEITHAFDDMGGQYDENGDLRDWWQPEDWATFKERRQCIIDQYGNYFFKAAGKYLNGINTQGENVADSGGLKTTFRAYKKLVKRKGIDKLLPGLNLTHDQLFFLGYAQLWCSKLTKERAVLQVNSWRHSPGRFRIMGPLQNSPDFAKAYSCPAGSPMNPEKKCNVW